MCLVGWKRGFILGFIVVSTHVLIPCFDSSISICNCVRIRNWIIRLKLNWLNIRRSPAETPEYHSCQTLDSYNIQIYIITYTIYDISYSGPGKIDTFWVPPKIGKCVNLSGNFFVSIFPEKFFLSKIVVLKSREH